MHVAMAAKLSFRQSSTLLKQLLQNKVIFLLCATEFSAFLLVSAEW